MRLPKRMKIGGHEVKVLFPHHFRQNPDLCGQANYGLNEIRVAESDLCGARWSESSIETTFLHEVIHWVGHVYYGEKSLEEQLVCALAQGLHQVLKDNRIKFFDEDLQEE